ncbi:hypothetical protein FPOA_05478 [Fusarium poae]|uniref:Uncharacterized protein n=1 Tax=Fusarium poae TaxID=36050 RepID=A0A1B8AWN8_FUSPO|nr:hypothetical protein FPOA_05478 [Fusarium poae]
MADTIPAPYDTVGLSDARKRVQKCFQRIYRKIKLWPWEWLPPNFNPRPEDWNINCSQNVAQVVDLVSEDGSLITHFELRDFLVRLYEDSHRRQDETSGLSSRLATDCRLAKQWISQMQNERKVATIVQAPENSEPVSDSLRNGECCDSQAESDSESDTDTDILNIPQGFEIPKDANGIHNQRSFTHTEPETDVNHSLINQMQAPMLQQSVPRKRARRSVSPDSDYSIPPEEGSISHSFNADLEVHQIQTHYRISASRNIQALDERIENTEKLMKLCSDEVIDREHAAKHLNVHDKERARQEASELLEEAQGQLKEAESFKQSMAARVKKRGDKYPKPYYDAYSESIRDLEGARKRHDHAKMNLEALEYDTESGLQTYTETLERIEILKDNITECERVITKETKEKRAFYAKLAILDILGCNKLDLVPTETLEMFCSSTNEVLRSVNENMSEI